MKPFPRHLKPVRDSLGLYFRPGYGDHTTLLERLLDGQHK